MSAVDTEPTGNAWWIWAKGKTETGETPAKVLQKCSHLLMILISTGGNVLDCEDILHEPSESSKSRTKGLSCIC